MERSDAMQLVMMYGSFAAIIAVMFYVPREYGVYVLPILLFVPLALIMLYEVKVRLSYYKLKVLEMIIRSDSDMKKKIFIDRWNSTLLQKSSTPVYRTELIVKPFKYKEFGKVDRVYLIHEGEFLKKVKWGTQPISVEGYTFPHPYVDYAVVYECEEPYFDHGQFFPVFVLERAGGDYRQSFYKYAEEEKITDPKVLREKIKWLKTQMHGMRSTISKLTEDNIRLESEVKELSDTVKGLLDASKKKADTARKFIIDVLNRHASLEAAAKEVGARMESPWLYVLAIVAFGGIVALLALRPEYAQSLGQWLNQTNNQIFLIVLAAVILAVVYITKKKRGVR
jgi:regulator of replication initiation timing